jgi:hypothetical protein
MSGTDNTEIKVSERHAALLRRRLPGLHSLYRINETAGPTPPARGR